MNKPTDASLPAAPCRSAPHAASVPKSQYTDGPVPVLGDELPVAPVIPADFDVLKPDWKLPSFVSLPGAQRQAIRKYILAIAEMSRLANTPLGMIAGVPAPGPDAWWKANPAAQTDAAPYYCLRCRRYAYAYTDSGKSSCCFYPMEDRRTGKLVLSVPERIKPHFSSTAIAGVRSSEHYGVFRLKNGNWRCSIFRNGRKHFVGDFYEEFSAAAAYDNAAVYLFRHGFTTIVGKLNHPELYDPPADPAPFASTQRVLRRLEGIRLAHALRRIPPKNL